MNRKLLLFGGGGLAVIAAAVFAAWFFYFRSDAPEEVSLEGALETVRTPTATSLAGAGSTPTAGATQPAGGSASGGLDGTWTVAAAGETFVGYRVQEELAQIGAVTAVGRTSDVKGSVTIKGNRVEPGNTFTANMQALKSDRAQRDNALRTQALETNRFPTSTFTLKEAVTLPASFANGEALTTTLKGSLELHGVTRDVEIPVQAKLENGLIVVVGSLEIRFADYNIAQPRAPIVLSVDDKGVMEIQLVLQKQG